MQFIIGMIILIVVVYYIAPYLGLIFGIVGVGLIIWHLLSDQKNAKRYAVAGTLEEIQRKAEETEKKLQDDKKACEKELAELRKEIKLLSTDCIVAATQVFVDENILSEEYKNQLSVLKTKQSDLIKEGKAIVSTSSDTKKVQNNNIKQMLRSFNAECEVIISAVNIKNVDQMRAKIQKSYEQLNKIFETDGVVLNSKYLEMKLQELVLVHSYQVKIEQERAEQKAIREQMVEEDKVRREIEKEKAKIEKEEIQFKSEIDKLMKYLQKATDIEKQLYVDKIKELEAKLALLAIDKENVFQREQNTRAGFVYIISNIGSLGEDVYKIGMTRRLEPLERVKELSDASVPFEFDVHAMIFSEDAPALENILHQTFRSSEVNKINHRKEFFRVPLREVEQVVKDNYNATVRFTEVALATEYRESLRLQTEETAVTV